MSRGPCTYCHSQPIVGRLRKYCPEHSRQASAIWKRQHPEWRTPWKATVEERRAYIRWYMRRYRYRRRVLLEALPKTGDALCSTCRGVLRLQARVTRLPHDTSPSDRRRAAAAAEWFVLTLEQVNPCRAHRGVLRLARHLTATLLAARSMEEEAGWTPA